MPKYFSVFPKILYSVDDYKSSQYITDITKRFKFKDELVNNVSAFFYYVIKDTDTPEIIAAKYYDSSYRYWIILLINNIIDPQYQWPLSDYTLQRYINKKYADYTESEEENAGLNWARENMRSYYKIESVSYPSGIIENNIYEIDANTYATIILDQPRNIVLSDGNSITISTSKNTQTYLEYEVAENEKKREIKILRKEFVIPLENELKQILSNA